MEFKIKNIIVDKNPVLDIDCEFGSYDLPYEIHVSIDGKILKTNKRRLMSCYESNSLLSMADCYNYLSDEGRQKFISQFLSTYLAPIVWKIRWGSKITKKQFGLFEFAMDKLRDIDKEKYDEYLLYTQKVKK